MQNCHLAVSWMSQLEAIVEGLSDSVHKDFRLWLTSMPSGGFPISILQNSVKMTIEPPQGLKANLKKSYSVMDDKEINDCKKPDYFKKLLWGMCFFHAAINERKKFGPIGWNIQYEFTFEDHVCCKRQLKVFMDEYSDTPWKVINFICAEINYGGRVTDDKDLKLIITILRQYICTDILKENHSLGGKGSYIVPPSGDLQEYLQYIDKLPLNTVPEVFGMHENADITNAQNVTRTLLGQLLGIMPRAASGVGKSEEEQIADGARLLESKAPPPWDYEEIYKKYPTLLSESMNTVLTQEIIRYNNLLRAMQSQIRDVQKALRGEVVMSSDLEVVAKAIYLTQVPTTWQFPIGPLSLKPLVSWIEDIIDRYNFLQKWVENGKPDAFWFSGFFFPQAFITGCLQNYARKYNIAIDRLSFEIKIIDDIKPQDIAEPPEDGAYVYGMFLEGARWDPRKKALSSPLPKELFSSFPTIWLNPVADRVPEQVKILFCSFKKYFLGRDLFVSAI